MGRLRGLPSRHGKMNRVIEIDPGPRALVGQALLNDSGDSTKRAERIKGLMLRHTEFHTATMTTLRTSTMTTIAKHLILAVALLGGLTASAQAQATNTLYIGDLGGQTVLRYDATTITNPTAINGPGNPWLSNFSPEGITAGVNGLPGSNSSILFVANDSAGTIKTVNANASTNPVINSDFITVPPGAGRTVGIVAGISVSSDGHYLYVADQSANEILKYNTVTGALVASASLPGAHDVLAAPDGSVYASGFGQDDGVVKFNANLTSSTQFIAPDAHGLTNASGLVLDGAGNLWVSNTDLSHPGNSLVEEYSTTGPTGSLLMTVSGSPLFNPLGLTLGPDGNIYVANLGDLSNGNGRRCP